MSLRLVTIALSCCFAAALFAGCSSGSSSGSSSSQSGSDAANEAQPAEQAQQAEQATDAKYAVTIDNATVMTDYQDQPALVVDYTFTNNSDKATSFMVAIHAQAFQNGVELKSAIGSDWDSSNAMSDIKPGATVTVQEAYLLNDQSDVTVECTELISFDDTIIAEAVFSVA